MKRIFTSLILLFVFISSFAATPPTVTSSNMKFSSPDGKSFSMTFTAGNGTYRIIVMKEGGPVTGLPENGKEYSANSNFGTAGTEFTQAGEYVVASKTSWTSFTFQNLKPSTTYHIAVFEYNGTGTNADYLMLPLAGNTTTVTAPSTQAAFTTTTTTGNTITLNFSKGNGTGRLVLARKGEAVNTVPVDLTNYYVDETFGNGAKLNTDNYVVYRGAGTSVTVKNVEPNTTYHFAVFEYNGNSSPVFLGPGATKSVSTNPGPTTASSAIGLSYVEGNSFRLGCTPGNGSHRLFIMSKNGVISATPQNGTNYTANTAFGTPNTEIAPGEFVVGATTGTSVSVTNLEGNTLYYFRIYDYDKDQAGNTYYLTSSSAVKTGSTAMIPTTIGTNVRVTAMTGSTASIGLTHGNGTMRMVIVKEGSPVDATPADYTSYSGGNFGSGTQITPGNFVTHGGINGNPFTINNLKPGFTYHVAIYEYNGSSAPVYSRTAATISFTIPAEPTACATAPWSVFNDGSSFRFVWTSGNGSRRIVIARKGAPVTAKPVDGTTYTADANVGEGDALEEGQFVVYDGNYYSVDLAHMEPGSTYHFAVFEYNVSASGSPDYLTSCWLAGTASTVGTPAVQTTLQSATSVQATQATINFTKGDGSSRLVIMREGAPVNVTPQDLVKYSYSTAFGAAHTRMGNDNYVVLVSGGTGNFTVTNLKPQTTYHIAAFEFNGSAQPVYLREEATLSFTTTDVPGATVPTSPATNAIFSNVDGNKFNLKWTNGNGEKRIVVMKKGSEVNFVPSPSTNYTANASFGTGTNLGDEEYVVYNGNGASVDITGLQPSAIYHVAIFEYNGTGELIRYLTSSKLIASGSSAVAPIMPVHDVEATIGTNSVTLSWQNGSGEGRIVVMKEGSAVAGAPADLGLYPAGAIFKSGSQIAAGEYVVYAGTGSSVTVTGLTDNTYHYRIFEYNGNSAPVYNNSSFASGSVTIGSSLPVELLFFTAEEKNEAVLLKWATSQELNNDYFEVERSNDGRLFETVSKITGAGNSNAYLEYSYTDPLQGTTGKVYYRLKQVDIDGKFEYSKIVSVQVANHENKLVVYPNPFHDQLNIKLPTSVTGVLNIYNASGVLVLSKNVTAVQQVNVSNLPAGVYYLVIQADKRKYQHAVVKD